MDLAICAPRLSANVRQLGEQRSRSMKKEGPMSLKTFRFVGCCLLVLPMVAGCEGSVSSAQSENLASRVADRLATQMMLSQTFSRWPFSDFELEELAEAPGGLELVLPRTQTVMSELPLDREGSKVYQTYAVGALEASLKTSDLIELRVDEIFRTLVATTKQRAERAAETQRKAR